MAYELKNAIVIKTNKGIMHIYLKGKDAIVTIENDRSIVNFISAYNISDIIDKKTNLLTKVLPPQWATKAIARNITSLGSVILNQGNDTIDVDFEKIPRKNKEVKYTIFNSSKIDNIFDQYEKNPEKFNGFCNYIIEIDGNIFNLKEEMLKSLYKINHSVEEIMDVSDDENNGKIVVEEYIQKRIEDYVNKNSELSDIEKHKLTSLSSNLESLKYGYNDNVEMNDSEKYDLIEYTYKKIKTSGFEWENIIKDSRINGVYKNEEIEKGISEIFMKEMCLKYPNLGFDEMYYQEANSKLKGIVEEDIYSAFIGEERKNVDELMVTKFLKSSYKVSLKEKMEKEVEKAKSIENDEQKLNEKVVNIKKEFQKLNIGEKFNSLLNIRRFKEYVNLIECMSIPKEGEAFAEVVIKAMDKSNTEWQNTKDMSPKIRNYHTYDKLAVIIKNMEAQIKNEGFPECGIEAKDELISKCLMFAKSEVIKQKFKCDEVVFFPHRGESEKDAELLESMYIVKNNKVHVFINNIHKEIRDMDEVRSEYAKYFGKEKVQDESLNRLMSIRNLINHEYKGAIPLEYQKNGMSSSELFMRLTALSEKRIIRNGIINELIDYHISDELEAQDVAYGVGCIMRAKEKENSKKEIMKKIETMDTIELVKFLTSKVEYVRDDKDEMKIQEDYDKQIEKETLHLALLEEENILADDTDTGDMKKVKIQNDITDSNDVDYVLNRCILKNIRLFSRMLADSSESEEKTLEEDENFDIDSLFEQKENEEEKNITIGSDNEEIQEAENDDDYEI